MSVYDEEITDALAATDDTDPGAVFQNAITDAATVADVAARFPTFYRSTGEAVTLTDTLSLVFHPSGIGSLVIGNGSVRHTLVVAATGLCGEAGEADLTLPELTLAVTALCGGGGTAALELPPFFDDVDEENGVGINGTAGTGTPELPALEAAGGDTERVGTGESIMPALEVSATGLTGSAGTAALTLPDLSIDTSGALSPTGTGASTMPLFTVSAWMVAGNTGTCAATLVLLTATGTGKTGVVGTAALTLPMLTDSSSGNEDQITGTESATLPMFIVDAYGGTDEIAGMAADYFLVAVAAMNTGNFGTSEYYDYNFASFCRHDGSHYGGGADGIYLLSGATDNGTAIAASIEKREMDLGTAKMKRLTDVYLQLRSDGNYTIKIVGDGNVVEIPVTDAGANLHAKKVDLPRGLMGRRVGFGFSNASGSDFTLDDFEFEWEVLSRRSRR